MGLCTVTFPAARRTRKQGIFALSDPVRGGQFEDQVAIHPGVELEVEVVQALVRIAKLRLFVASLKEPLAAAGQLIRDQRGDQVDGGHVLRLRLQKTGFHHCGHAAHLMKRFSSWLVPRIKLREPTIEASGTRSSRSRETR